MSKILKRIIEDAVAFDDLVSNYGKDDINDVNVEIARSNYQLYQNDLQQLQQDYIKTLCRKIKEVSRRGDKFFDTKVFRIDKDEDKILWAINNDDGCADEFPSSSSIQYFKKYFEERGFCVAIRKSYNDPSLCYLRISWLD